MADTLLVRFSQDGQECPEWLEAENRAQQPQTGSWQELAAAVQQRRVVLLLPASAVLLLEVELPVKNPGQLKKALPYALEDLLAEDVENYHLAWFGLPQNKVAVAAIAHETMQAYMTACRQAQLEPDAVYPETLLLPYQPGECSLLIEAGQAVIRNGVWQGGGVDAEFLPQLLDKLLAEQPECWRLNIWTGPSAAALPALSLEAVYQPGVAGLQVYAANGELPQALNLLTGPYALKTNRDIAWRSYLPALVLLLIGLGVQSAALLSANWRQQAELSRLEAQTLELFKQSFPEIKRIVNVKVQAEQQLAELKKLGSRSGGGFLRILQQAGGVLKDYPAFQLSKINYQNGILQLQLSGGDLGQLEQLKQQLPQELQVKILSADSGANGVEAHLEISER